MSQEKKVLYSFWRVKTSLIYSESSTQQKNPIIIDDDRPIPKRKVTNRNVAASLVSTQAAKDKKEKKIDKKEKDLI